MRRPHEAGGSNRGGGSTRTTPEYTMGERTRVSPAKPSATPDQMVSPDYTLGERTRVSPAKPQ